MSVVRMIAMFTRPPVKPASTPSVVPIAKARNTGVIPMNQDSRPPNSSRVSMSRPSSSVPSG